MIKQLQLPDTVAVGGFIYDVDTGLLEQLF